jgi:hypothetical protein
MYIESVNTFANDNRAPELYSEEMLRIIEIQIFQFPSDDLVDSREDNVIDWSKSFKHFHKCFFIADVAYCTRSMWRV